MRLSDKQKIHAERMAILTLVANKITGYKFTEGEGERSKEQQAIYLKKKKTKVKISQHQKRLADDRYLYVYNVYMDGKTPETKEPYRILGELWEKMGTKECPARWGGRFGVKKKNYGKELGWDCGHFESR